MLRRVALGLWFALAAQGLLVTHAAAATEFRAAADDAVVLYDAPSVQSQKRFIVNQGYPLEVIVVLQGWVKVRDASGALSWVEAGKVSNRQRTIMVKTPLAQIRFAADDSSPVVFQAQQNVVMELSEVVAGGWLRVRHRDGVAGFVRVAQVWGV